MAHFPKPFFRAPRNRWYVQLNGDQINLGPDKDEAFRLYHELMAKPREAKPKLDVRSIVAIIELFLEWTKTHREPLTYAWYLERTQAFVNFKTRNYRVSSLTIDQLKPFHVQEWVDSHDWSNSHKRGCTIAVQRAFRWAEKIGHIDKSPIRYVEKPEQGKREQVISPEEFQKMLARYRDQQFRDLLNFSWETGSRPQEAIRIEARHVEHQHGRIVIPPDEAKGKKRYRVIYLNERALAIVERLCKRWPHGQIFRNMDNVPWTADAVNCRFCRLEKHLGVKYALYAFRHSFANRMLESGCDALTVSTLLGHVDGSMLAKVYSHLSGSSEYLRGAVLKMG